MFVNLILLASSGRKWLTEVEEVALNPSAATSQWAYTAGHRQSRSRVDVASLNDRPLYGLRKVGKRYGAAAALNHDSAALTQL